MGNLTKRIVVVVDGRTGKAQRHFRDLRNETDKGSAAQKRFRANVKAVGAGLATVAVAAAGAGAAVGRFVLAETESLDKIGKSARALGASNDEFQRLSLVAKKAGSSQEGLTKGLRALTVGLQDAATKGTGPVVEGLDALDLKAEDLRGKNIEQQFELLADELQRVDNEQTKAAISAKLFGTRAGVELSNTLRLGGAEIRAQGDELERMGAIIRDDTIVAAEDFQDRFAETEARVAKVKGELATGLIPAVEATAEVFLTAVPAVSSFSSELGDLAFELDVVLGLQDDVESGRNRIRGVGGIEGAAGEGGRQRRELLAGASSLNEQVVAEFEKAQALQGRLDRAQRANEEALAKAQREFEKGRKKGKSDPNKAEREAFNRELQSAKLAQGLGGGFRRQELVDLDPFAPENLELQQRAHEDHVAKVISLEQVKQERLLQDRLAAVEMSREQGVDPLTLIQREEDARAAFLQADLDRAEQADEIAQAERLRGQIEQVHHEARLRRIQEEREARQRQIASIVQVGQVTGQVMNNMGSATADFAAAFGASSSTQDKINRVTQGGFMVVRGITEQVEAIAAFARYDFVAGALHESASIAAFAAAAKIGAGGAGGGGGGRSVGVSGAFGGSAFGPGPAQAANGPTGGSASFNEIPLSGNSGDSRFGNFETPFATLNDAQQGGGRSSGGGNTIVLGPGAVQVTGAIDEQSALTIAKALDKVGRTAGKVSS